MNKHIAGVVVLYYPDEAQLLRNINSYVSFVGKLFVIDNTDKSLSAETVKDLLALENCEYLPLGSNKGIATALNHGAKLALSNGYSWLLTMDQDSIFENDQGAKYFSSFEDDLASDPLIAIASPTHFLTPSLSNTKKYSELIAVMTSGNLLRLDIWNQLDGFDEKLFIDEVDHEFCYRVKQHGFKIIQCNEIFLKHQLGSQQIGGYLGKIAKKSRRVHSPKRVYFMVRNYLYVRHQYKSWFPHEFRARDKALAVTLKNNLFFSGNFFQTFRSIRRGVKDYRNRNFINLP